MKSSLVTLATCSSAFLLVTGCSGSASDTGSPGPEPTYSECDGGAAQGLRSRSSRSGDAPCADEQTGSQKLVDASAPDASVRENQVNTTLFSLRIPAANVALDATMTDGSTPRVSVTKYPAEVSVKPRIDALLAGFDGPLSDTYCDEVARAAKQEKELFGASDHFSVTRASSNAALKIPVSPFVSTPFEYALTDAARAARSSVSSINFLNPLVLASGSLEVSFAPDAITNVIGTKDVVDSLTAQWTQQQTVGFLIGQISVGVNARDFVCDLWRGKASIRLTLDGTYGEKSYTGTTTLTGLEPK